MSVVKDLFCYVVASCFPFYGSGKYSLRGEKFFPPQRLKLVIAEMSISLRGDLYLSPRRREFFFSLILGFQQLYLGPSLWLCRSGFCSKSFLENMFYNIRPSI